jgi:hypothetical protein
MLKIQIYLVVLFSVVIFFFSTVTSNVSNHEYSKIQTILNNIKIDSALKYVKELSGELNINIDGESINIGSRYYSNPGNTYAEKYLLQKFNEFNIPTYVQDFGNGNRNIIGVKKGTKNPSMKYIICAHFDSYAKPNPSFAPGADDNASGTAAVLEAARILSKYETETTIEFALWDAEEIGLLGSDYYAKTARNNNDSILGVINLDMIAFDHQNDDKLLVNYQTNAYASAISERLTRFNSDYNIGLYLTENTTYIKGSDHRSFINKNYPALLLIEDGTPGDTISYYHSANDKASTLDIPFYEKCLKLSIITFASIVNIEDNATYVKKIEKLSDNTSLKTFPNPFNSTVNISFSLPSSNNISILVFDQIGRKIETIYKGGLNAGEHTFRWNPVNKPTGIYYLMMLTNSEKKIARVVYLK